MRNDFDMINIYMCILHKLFVYEIIRGKIITRGHYIITCGNQILRGGIIFSRNCNVLLAGIKLALWCYLRASVVHGGEQTVFTVKTLKPE